MANRWGNNGNSEDFILGGSKISADGDCSHEIKRRLLLVRKVITNLDSILKSRDITLPTKIKFTEHSSSHIDTKLKKQEKKSFFLIMRIEYLLSTTLIYNIQQR